MPSAALWRLPGVELLIKGVLVGSSFNDLEGP